MSLWVLSTGRASGVFIDTPSAMTVPTLGAPKGSNVRYGLVREAAEAFDGEYCTTDLSNSD
jgi:hypothetical protein